MLAAEPDGRYFQVTLEFAYGCGAAELQASPYCCRVLLKGTCPFLR